MFGLNNGPVCQGRDQRLRRARRRRCGHNSRFSDRETSPYPAAHSRHRSGCSPRTTRHGRAPVVGRDEHHDVVVRALQVSAARVPVHRLGGDEARAQRLVLWCGIWGGFRRGQAQPNRGAVPRREHKHVIGCELRQLCTYSRRCGFATPGRGATSAVARGAASRGRRSHPVRASPGRST
jgi:hypothetical protein